MRKEAEIQHEIYRHLKNVIDKTPSYHGIVFDDIKPQVNVNGGYADIVLYAHGKPFLVIEAKRETGKERTRDFDPYSLPVIRQAHRYASLLGSKYFATYNGKIMAIFVTFEEGKSLLQRRSVSYEITDTAAFAPELLLELASLDKGIQPWDPQFNAFINRLSVFHERLAREYVLSLKRISATQRGVLIGWFKKQGWEFKDDAAKERFCSQCAYLMMNKILFYKTLAGRSSYRMPAFVQTGGGAEGDLKNLFANIVEEVDFEAVYGADPVFDDLKLTPLATNETIDLMSELDEYDLRSLSQDVIGEIYQRTIPSEDRHRLGQYYTPFPIVDLIVDLAVQSGEDIILDPACGSGGFLIGCYDRLKYLKDKKRASHRSILKQVYGIDINRFPIHLSAINLALRDLSEKTDQVNLEVSDFFDIEVDQMRLEVKRVSLSGGRRKQLSLPSMVDAVVGNPPYIRQELLDKEKCRRHLTDAELSIDAKSDIYVYFFTHAYQFLKPRGRLVFITSSRWLSVAYGLGLQRFLTGRFKVKAVIDPTHQVFDIPLIGTCVTVLERCEDEDERDSNIVSFIRLKGPMKKEEILGVLSDKSLPLGLHETDAYRLYKIEQAELAKSDKWMRFFMAPELYWDILRKGKTTSLQDLADLTRGLMSGANEFFYFRNQTDAVDAGLDVSVLSPLLKHPSETKWSRITDQDLEWRVFDLQKYLDALGYEGQTTSDEVKRFLKKQGKEGILEYISLGEERGHSAVPSVRGRRCWFNLGTLERYPVIFPEVYWRKCDCIMNDAGAVLDKRSYGLMPKQGISPLFLMGVLNSSYGLLMREMTGRTEQGEGMNRNTTMVYEAKQIAMPDPRQIPESNVQRVELSVKAIMDKERTCDDEAMKQLRKELDEAVLACVSLEKRVDELQSAVSELVKLREVGSGSMRTSTIQSEDKVDMAKLRGAVKLSVKRHKKMILKEQTRLDDFADS